VFYCGLRKAQFGSTKVSGLKVRSAADSRYRPPKKHRLTWVYVKCDTSSARVSGNANTGRLCSSKVDLSAEPAVRVISSFLVVLNRRPTQVLLPIRIVRRVRVRPALPSELHFS